MTEIDFESFRTYIEEAEAGEVPDPTLEQLADAEFWYDIGTGFLHYLGRRIEDPEPFQWYGHFLDKTIEALEHARNLAQQAQSNDFTYQTMLPIFLAQAYISRGQMSMFEGAYDAAFLDFDAAVLHHSDPQYQALRAQALSQLPS